MQYLIWSNEHRSWWRADHSGYTQLIEEAGRYPRADAEAIVANATVDGALTVRRTNPVTGMEYASLSEYMILAPERAEPAAPPTDDVPPRPLSDEDITDAVDAMTELEVRAALRFVAGARPVEFAGAMWVIERQRTAEPATCGGGCDR